MTERRTKPEKERFVFEQFVKACPLRIIGDPESRPEPEPDILCTLESGEQIAFELTQVDDPNYERLFNTSLDLNEQLQSAATSLPNRELFHGHSVSVQFRDFVKFAHRHNFIAQIIQVLRENGPADSYPLRDGSKIVGRIRCHNFGYDVPMSISTPCASGVGDYTVEIISKKLAKKYTTPHPVHLLAWAKSMFPPEFWRDDVSRLFREQSKFSRIWVFQYTGAEIQFDSAVDARDDA
jgi:hypothetical protein